MLKILIELYKFWEFKFIQFHFFLSIILQFQIGTVAMRKRSDSSQRTLTMLDQLTSQVEKYKVDLLNLWYRSRNYYPFSYYYFKMKYTFSDASNYAFKILYNIIGEIKCLSWKNDGNWLASLIFALSDSVLFSVLPS